MLHDEHVALALGVLHLGEHDVAEGVEGRGELELGDVALGEEVEPLHHLREGLDQTDDHTFNTRTTRSEKLVEGEGKHR